MGSVIVVIGAGSIGQAIARRVSAGKKVLLADLRRGKLPMRQPLCFSNAGFDVITATVDVSSRASVQTLVQTATALGDVTGVIHAAGVSPSQASPETILHVDLYGTALVLEAFGDVVAEGGSGVVISSQSGHRLPALTPEQNQALATTPTEELLELSFLQPAEVKDSLHAYQLSKRGNSLRVMAEAVRWGKRGARINTISPGIIMTPLAKDELTGPRGAGYRRMIEGSVAKRAGTPDEVGAVGALLMGTDGAFITGSDFLMDGGVTASYWYGDLAEMRLPMTKVLILGAYGQIARLAARLFLEQTDTQLTLYLRNAKRLKDISHQERVRVVEGDVLDGKTLDAAVAGQGCVLCQFVRTDGGTGAQHHQRDAQSRGQAPHIHQLDGDLWRGSPASATVRSSIRTGILRE